MYAPLYVRACVFGGTESWWNGELVVQWRSVWCLHCVLVTRLARSPSRTHTHPATQPTYLNTQPTTVLFVFVYLPIYLVGRVYLSIFVSSPPNIFLLSISFINRRLMCILVIIIFSFII